MQLMIKCLKEMEVNISYQIKIRELGEKIERRRKNM